MKWRTIVRSSPMPVRKSREVGKRTRKKKEREREKTTVLTYFRWVFFEFFSLPLENLVTVAPNNCYAKS
jgi:hypothetical protein